MPSPTPTVSPLTLSFPRMPEEILIQTLPDACPPFGHQAYEESPLGDLGLQGTELPIVLERGEILVVTADSDEANGDTSTVQALLQNPGTDGVSLREALLATNNDPAEYTIQFDPDLAGVAIQVGSWDRSELPPLSGGSVIINGDLDVDGEPDITLENATGAVRPGSNFFGLIIHSSNNTLYALRLIGFGDSVHFDAPATQQVYAGNTLSHLAIEGHLSGVNLYSGRCEDNAPCEESNNAWIDTRIIGNTIRARGGITMALARSSGDRIEGLTIQDNQLFISAEDEAEVYDGINLTSGYGSASTGNTIQNVLIADNTIEGNPILGIGVSTGSGGSGGNAVRNVQIVGNTLHAERKAILSDFGIQITAGFWVNKEGNSISDILVAENRIEGYLEAMLLISSGAVGSSGNRVERVRITNNQIKLLRPARDNGAPLMAISLVTGDGATDYADPSYQPVVYPDDNLIRDVWISKNVIEGQGGQAVSLGTGDPGSEGNQIREIYILGNEMRGFYAEAGSMVSAVSLYLGGRGDNHIAHVFIQQNTIQQANLREHFIGEEFYSGGIILTAGGGAEKNRTQDVWIVGNDISSPAPGITIVGGFSEPPMKPTVENTISGVRVWCNTITENPVLLQALFPYVRGISLAGGYGLAMGNRVADLVVQRNLVAGIEDDLSIVDDEGAGSEGNVVDYVP